MISIIIPIYNTSRYLAQCIESVLAQTYKDLEIILVIDASPDNSIDICRKYQKKDKRIQIINKEKNEGVDAARFTGLDVAKGEYVMFVDSDDWLEGNHTIEDMYHAMEKYDVDYVETGLQRVMDRHKLIKTKGISPVLGLINQPELFEKYYLSFFGVNILSVTIWGKLYRKSIIDSADIRPTYMAMGEDLAFNLQLFPHLNKIYIMDTIGYNYRFGGMTTRYNPKLYPNLKSLYLLKEKLIEKYQYYKAHDYIRIELKNVFRSDICQMITFHTASKQEIVDKITKELGDPVWTRVLDVKEHPGFAKDPFVMAIKAKDSNTIYEICNEQVQKEKFKRKIKYMISKIITHI